MAIIILMVWSMAVLVTSVLVMGMYSISTAITHEHNLEREYNEGFPTIISMEGSRIILDVTKLSEDDLERIKQVYQNTPLIPIVQQYMAKKFEKAKREALIGKLESKIQCLRWSQLDSTGLADISGSLDELIKASEKNGRKSDK
jgi:hypothetical protein